jgi:glycosyltransferase EpsJ
VRNLINLVSVVVPIYNVEKWLERCLATILNQPFTDLEIILVNDGSTDNCGKICEQYAQIDKRIKVVHKENRGLSSARNAGIEAATGKYIVFIDPDDVISQEYFEVLLSTAEKYNCDAVVSGYKKVPINDIVVPGFKLNEVMNGKDFVLSSSNIHSNNDLCFVWRYCYRLDVIKESNIKFNEQVFIGEDVIFNLEFLLKSSRVCAIQSNYYDYTVNNPDSLMRVPFKPKLEQSLVKQYEVRKRLSKKYGLLEDREYRTDMANYYLNTIYRRLLQNLRGNKESLNINKELKRIINYEMFIDSLQEIGYGYKTQSLKEYIYFLIVKFRIHQILAYLFIREKR